MRLFRRFGLYAAVLFVAIPAWAQSNIPRGKDVVAPTVYVSVEPVPRGRSFELAVAMKIRPGFHINAREASTDYLIPTDVKAEPPQGFRKGAVTYPKGTLRKFPFSPDKPLNVYEGTAVVRMTLTALADAPIGPQRIPLKLKYQACSEEVCLPPVTLALEAALEVAAMGAASRAAHQEIFNSK